ncbi:MAG: Ig-like domain-containing protein [bacterium]|nr:Ig-like domain-containing protein [bacterium]
MHEEGAIRLICRAFQSHENGLPEWLKNSADAYSRENAPEAKRVIVVILDSGRRQQKASISCLDFSGMTSAMIEQYFRRWADPEAAQCGVRNASVQGGHGNGGKCYMVQMFEDYSMLRTVKNGMECCYGVTGGSIRFGYIPDREKGRDLPISDLREELSKVLAGVGCSIRNLPEEVLKGLAMADGFTLLTGSSPRGYENRIAPIPLILNLQEHPQMIQTIQMCKVFVMVNGEPANGGKSLSLAEIKPIAGAEKPRTIQIPNALKDPLTEQEISTTQSGALPSGTLTLRTSDVSMRWSKKGRHNVIYKAQSGYIGYVPVCELDIQSPYRDRIYGECSLDALEPLKQNERARLANNPLSRAVESFISKQIQAYAKEFEARDRRSYDQKEQDAISKINEALDRWKNRFINELMQGLWGRGDGTTKKPAPAPLPTGRPAKLELTLSNQRAGIGVSFRPTLKFYDASGRHIRPIPYRWISEDTNVAMVDDDLMIVNTFAIGRTSIYAETLDGRLRSNKVPLEVVCIQDIVISPEEVQLPAGSRSKLEAICQLAGGGQSSGVSVVWTESNPNIARVSSSGLLFAFSQGNTEVIAGDDKCIARRPAIVRVTPSTGRGQGDQRGKSLPLVLVSGIHSDPENKEAVNFSREDPPVAQRPQDVDRNIWWINSASPLARLYLDNNKGYGYQTREWRMYHLERYIDIIVQIALTHGPKEKESLSVNDWIMEWGAQAAEIQEAASADLFDFLATGELPKE